MRLCVANVTNIYWTRVAAQADSAFKEHTSPLNLALKEIGRDFYRDLTKKGQSLINKVKKTARSTSADFGYLMMTLVDGRETWPITDRMALGLDMMVDLIVRSGKIPKYKINVPRGERGDEAVDKAILRLAQWVDTHFTKELRQELYKKAKKSAKVLRKKVKIDLTTLELAQYLMVKFAEKLRKGMLVVQNASPLRRILRVLSRKRS